MAADTEASSSQAYNPHLPEDPFFPPSRRSPLMATRGMVASSQPLASEAGLRILRQGGNAADAAVAMAAALAVTEPCSTGLGGDAFVLYYSASTKSVQCIQGNGRCPSSLSLSHLLSLGYSHAPYRPLPRSHALNVTVPGAAAAWCDTIERFGSKPLAEVLQPAAELADSGWPVPLFTVVQWEKGVKQLLDGGPHGGELLVDGNRAPKVGEIMKNPCMGDTLREIMNHGKAGFYSGRVAQAIVSAVQDKGGVLSLSDLSSHSSTSHPPISTTYRDVTVWEVPPPTAGAAALIALNVTEAAAQVKELPRGSADHTHLLIEAMRRGFSDVLTYVGDQAHVAVPLDVLLSKEYARERAEGLSMESAGEVEPGKVVRGGEGGGEAIGKGGGGGQMMGDKEGGDTVYFCAVDNEGNACSMINSNYMGFGTGIVPQGCGFSIQNRGYNFSLDPSHPNCLAPQKRPYHTIIPGLATWTIPADVAGATGQSGEDGGVPAGDLFCAFGVMGGFMQPQGHLQVITNLVDYNLDPQAAIDAPRFCLLGFPCSERGHGPHPVRNSHVAVEDRPGVEGLIEELKRRGHRVDLVKAYERELFGKGQVIVRDRRSGVLWGGSEGRADGCAMGF